jgi:hypothetical protein
MFLHERGAYNTLYFTTYLGSLMIGHIISGAMALHGATFGGSMWLFSAPPLPA